MPAFPDLNPLNSFKKFIKLTCNDVHGLVGWSTVNELGWSSVRCFALALSFTFFQNLVTQSSVSLSEPVSNVHTCHGFSSP